ncbi:hypothetical protein Q5752_004649 [Cryptotrichosporon argae]
MATINSDIPAEPALASYDDKPVVADATAWEKFVSLVWDPDFATKSHAERRLVFKLDVTLLTALTIGWWIKNIDQTNLANAYVSGMKEDLDITGNQYTYMGVIYNAVVCVGCLVGNFIALKIRPSWFFAGCEIGWGIFTFAQAGARTYQDMYGFRFGVAFFESFYYPVSFFLFGSWYTKRELNKRMGLWFIAGPAGSAFSGYMQAAIYENLDGHGGLAGWRWLYIICGCMTIPVGLVMFFLIPDFPETTRAWFLNEEERQLARARGTRNGTEAVTGKIDTRVLLSALGSWKAWLCIPWYAIFGLAVQNNSQFGVYLKAYGYSVTARNVLPSTAYIIEIPFLFLYTYIADRTPVRWRPLVVIVPLAWGLFPTGVLAFWAPSNALRVFAFMINGSLYITPVFYAWVAQLCGGRTELRAFITGATSCAFYLFNAWLPAIIFKQTDSPRFKKGFTSNFFFCLAALVLAIAMWVLSEREDRRNRAEGDAKPEGSLTEAAGSESEYKDESKA